MLRVVGISAVAQLGHRVVRVAPEIHAASTKTHHPAIEGVKQTMTAVARMRSVTLNKAPVQFPMTMIRIQEMVEATVVLVDGIAEIARSQSVVLDHRIGSWIQDRKRGRPQPRAVSLIVTVVTGTVRP